jgi:L-lactate dehydrogenase (cytochrome)
MDNFSRIGVALLCAATVQMAWAQVDHYPSRPITLIIPFPAGGATDLQGRLLAKLASQKLGQPVVTVNRPGASGTVGPAWMIQNTKPDGYTISITGAALFMQPHIAKVGFDPLTDFSYISAVALYGNGLVVGADAGWKTLGDLVKDAKSRPGEISWGSAGASGGGRIIMETLQDVAKVKFGYIPFKGGTEQFMGVAGGTLDAAADPGFSPLVKTGKVRLLSVFGDSRLKNWPDVPTAKEAGFDMNYRSAWGVIGHKDLPRGDAGAGIQACRRRQRLRDVLSRQRRLCEVRARGIRQQGRGCPQVRHQAGLSAVPQITSVEDLRLLARARVPRMFYDFVDSGSWTESTYRANAADLARLRFRQRVGQRIDGRDLRSTMLGQPVQMPVAIAPTGMTGMVHADGEILAAQAAKEAGVPFTLSTMSICSMEDVSRGVDGHPFWFQLYVLKDRQFVSALIERAKAIDCSALVLTMDLQAAGQRHSSIKNGLSVPPRLTLRNALDTATKARWLWNMARTERRTLGNIAGHLPGFEDVGRISGWAAQQFDPTFSWQDIESIKRQWGGKLILKGIMDPEDARMAVEVGADALIVSNHGGRQLDGALSSIAALPSIVQAVGDRIEVHLDGGITSGQDVLKAIAHGARGVYIGRAMLYGLGAMGRDGVKRTLEIIKKEMELTLAFCGCSSISEINGRILSS